MISRTEATTIVNSKIQKYEKELGIALTLMDNSTIETEFAWIFFYNSVEFIQTGNLSSALTGNSPLIVDKMDGSVHVTGTAKPIEFYIEEYKRSLKSRFN